MRTVRTFTGRTFTGRTLAGLAVAALVAGCSGSVSSTSGSPSASGPAPTVPVVTSTPGAAPADWPGYHGDAAHSGLAATMPPAGALTTAWRAAMDGVVQASPLVVGDTVVAATENDTVYGLDRATGRVRWSRHLATPVAQSSLPCGNITPTVGITGTPVYDPATQRVFAVTTTRVSGAVRHTLVGLDLGTGELRTSTPVDPAGSHPEVQNQRGALSLAAPSGRVVVPLGGHNGDCGEYHGYLVSVVAATGEGTTTFRAGAGTEAGMWQPAGAAVDSAGFAFAVSGNGSGTSGAYDGSDSVERVDPATGRSASFFAPAAWAAENAADRDLGSSGVALVGDRLWIQGKTSTGYLLDAADLGGIGHPVATVTGACRTQFGGPAVHGTTVYAPCTDGVRQLQVRPDGVDLGWRADSAVTGSPVVGGGRVWSVSDGTLFSLDEATGKTVATAEVGPGARFVTPALSGRLVLVPTNTGITAISTG